MEPISLKLTNISYHEAQPGLLPSISYLPNLNIKYYHEKNKENLLKFNTTKKNNLDFKSQTKHHEFDI